MQLLLGKGVAALTGASPVSAEIYKFLYCNGLQPRPRPIPLTPIFGFPNFRTICLIDWFKSCTTHQDVSPGLTKTWAYFLYITKDETVIYAKIHRLIAGFARNSF